LSLPQITFKMHNSHTEPCTDHISKSLFQAAGRRTNLPSALQRRLEFSLFFLYISLFWLNCRFGFKIWCLVEFDVTGHASVDLHCRITPYEWTSTHPCNNEPEELENNLTLCNLIWHNCGSIMQQGSDIAPK
jgi:hypothetical protein